MYVLCASMSCRKVHISKATLDALQDAYVVQPGEGRVRNGYLDEHNVETFFIVARRSRPTYLTVEVWKAFRPPLSLPLPLPPPLPLPLPLPIASLDAGTRGRSSNSESGEFTSGDYT